MDPLPTHCELTQDIVVAQIAADDSASLRRQLRRRTTRGDPERQKRIQHMVSSLSAHGSVLRSHLKRSDHHSRVYSSGHRAAIKRGLGRLRYERRQLKKMLPP